MYQLPVCLCIHISRNTWQPNGGMSKRQDFVQFPMRLSLAAYTFIQTQYQRKVTSSVSCDVLLLSKLCTFLSVSQNNYTCSGKCTMYYYIPWCRVRKKKPPIFHINLKRCCKFYFFKIKVEVLIV